MRRIAFASRPGANSEPCEQNFAFERCQFPKLEQPNFVLVKTLYLSVDPALRCCMNVETGVDYLEPWQIGETVDGLGGVGVVEKSQHPNWKAGDIVTNGQLKWPWQSYAILDGNELVTVDNALGDKIQLPLSCLGLIGLTVLLGIREKGHIRKGQDVFVVSAAAGACGTLAGQIARIEGCKKIIGICGSDHKCSILKKELGFDEVINYKTQNVSETLKKVCPEGVNVYFDNVGGEVSNGVISNMNEGGHIILCGQISQYNKDVPYPPPIPPDVQEMLTEKSISRDRFLVLNYGDKYPESLAQLFEWIATGKLIVKETIEEGLEHTGRAFVNMMKGGNVGKMLIHVADP